MVTKQMGTTKVECNRSAFLTLPLTILVIYPIDYENAGHLVDDVRLYTCQQTESRVLIVL